MILGNMLQSVLAFILFTFITIEVMIMNGYDPALHHASLLVWHPNLSMTYGYLLFVVIALGMFALVGSIIWLGAAFFVQMILFLLTFFAGEGSGMVWGTANVTPFFHPWALPSVLLLGTMALMVTLVSRRSEPAINNIQNRTAMIGIALAQVWLHVTVELQHLGQKLLWHPEVSARVLSMWWILFAVVVLAAGFYFQKSRLRLGGMFLLVIPFVFNFSAILHGSDLFLTAVWTILPLALAAFGGRYNYPEVVKGALCFLGITCVCDLLSSVERRSGVISLVWWAAAASVAMGIGFKEHQKLIRQSAIGIFAIITFKLFTVDLLSISSVGIRISAYIGTGLLMVGASYLYQRFDTSKPKK
jgi:predicted membrane protein